MATASNMLAFLRDKATQRHAAVHAHATTARAAARDLARLLADEFGASQVWLFGSLAWGEPDLDADIDLAVTGLDPDAYFAALGRLLCAAPFSVDLVCLQEAPEALRTRILRDGEALL